MEAIQGGVIFHAVHNKKICSLIRHPLGIFLAIFLAIFHAITLPIFLAIFHAIFHADQRAKRLTA